MKKFTLLIFALSLLTIQVSGQEKTREKEPPSQTTELSTLSLAELVKQQSNAYVITKQHVSSISGIHHIYLRQAINGLEVYGTESSVHIDRNGELLVEHNKFLKNIQATVKSSAQGISASQAITSVARQMHYPINNLQEIKSIGGKNKAAVFNKAGISSEEIPAKLMYYYREGIGTYLVWELSIAETTSSDWWNFRVDASTGMIIDKDNWTISCNILGDHNDHIHTADSAAPFVGPMEQPINYNTTDVSTMVAPPPAASYRVYPMPVETPNHGGRILVTNPEDLIASPYGWHDINGTYTADYTSTRGNNVDAYTDHNANNRPEDNYAYSPGGNLIFDFPINTNYSSSNRSEDAAVTNLFYWNNIIHDVAYRYGFDEASGNFQHNNYGNGGFGNDPVNAEAQDGSGTCNANFATPPDGQRPRMQMYVCGARDGDLDNLVIIHEYAHGISNRLSTLGGSEQMGEGWSDYYGLMLTMQSGDSGSDSRGIGTWLIGEGANGPGIRTHPYSTNFSINPHTYDDIKTEVAPHGVGSVWAQMLWEMTWELIDLHGFDTDFYNGNGGNNIALALVTEALKLQPSYPGFVDGRDAILAADNAMYGGANQCAIWNAFARRGLGFSADQGSSSSKTDGTEAFDLPPTFSSLEVVEEVCLSDGVQTGLSGGNPTGGIYSGLGVTDDGNGATFTFDPSVAGPGLVTITYEVDDFCTGTPTSLTDDILITNNPPEIICMGSGSIPMSNSQSSTVGVPIPDGNSTGVTVTMNVTEDVLITDLDVDLNITHTWVGDLIVKIKSPSGTTAVIVDRPGRTTSGFGCAGDDIDATLDDEAETYIENECSNSVPTIEGRFKPNNPLSVFDGESSLGVWELNVSDVASSFSGTLNSWGITYEYEIEAPILDVTLDGSGNVTVNAEDLLYGVTVECGSYTVLAGSPLASTVSFSCSDIGLNTVLVEVTNDSGASSTCSAVVNVIGDIGGGGPLLCSENIVQSNDPGVCGATVTYTVDSPAGCGGTGTITQTTGLPSGSVFPIGTTTNTFVYDDGINPAETCSFTVTINDTEAPTVVCQNITVQLDASGNASITVADIDGGSTDNCGIASSSISKTTFTCADIGENNVTLTVTDINGNEGTCVAVVTVEDNIPPTITCPADIIISAEAGMCSAVVIFPTPSASDNCSVTVTQTSGLASGSSFPVGVNTVEFTATDGGENTTACSFTITVEDNEAPVAVCQNITIQLDASGNATLTAADVNGGSTDNCSIASMSISKNTFTCADIGENNITLTVTDENGNEDTCVAVVTVEDSIVPVITCPADQTVDIEPGDEFYSVPDYFDTGEATAVDNCTDPVTITTQDPIAGTQLPEGAHTITLTAEDAYGNESSCSFELTVNAVLGIGDLDLGSVELYPNPANHSVVIGNPSRLTLENLRILDLRGRLIIEVDLKNMGTEKAIDISRLASSTYFVLIKGKDGQVIKKLIKE